MRDILRWVLHWFSSVPGEPPTVNSRTMVVPYESRTFVVALEERTFTV